MGTIQEEPTLHELLSRVAALEQANGRLQEELTSLGAERAAAEEQANGQTRTRTRKSSRRKVLEKGLGVAVATVGAGALLELSSGAGMAAVTATGSSGADGVDASDSGTVVKASSGSGTGVSATSSSGPALVATSSSGLAGHFVGGNVNMDNNLTVTGALSTGTLSSGAGALASSVGGTPAVKATGTNGAHGVDASSTGTGILATGGDVAVSGTGGNVGFLGFGTFGVQAAAASAGASAS